MRSFWHAFHNHAYFVSVFINVDDRFEHGAPLFQLSTIERNTLFGAFNRIIRKVRLTEPTRTLGGSHRAKTTCTTRRPNADSTDPQHNQRCKLMLQTRHVYFLFLMVTRIFD